jgi:8-oxo-dGTP pyrophosphatase MutT (NUDIX family)
MEPITPDIGESTISSNHQMVPQCSITDKVGVGTIFVSVDTGRVLLNLRAPHKTHAMQWSLWGGMIESGEQPRDALFRELSEEMGFVPDIEKIYPFDVYQSRDRHFRYYSFVCVVLEEFIPILNHESCGYCWVSLGEWPRPMHQGARVSFCNLKAVEKIRLILSQHTTF